MLNLKKMLNNWREHRNFIRGEKLRNKLDKKDAKMAKRVKKLQIKNFNIYYIINRENTRYQFVYEASTIFNSTKEEVIREIFGNSKPKERIIENGVVMYYKGKVSLIFDLKNK